jgi:hypothetical protein
LDFLVTHRRRHFAAPRLHRFNATETWIREVWEFRLSERSWSRLSLPGDAAVGALTHFIDGRLFLFDSSCAPGSFIAPETGEWGVTSWPADLSWPLYLLELDILAAGGSVDGRRGAMRVG